MPVFVGNKREKNETLEEGQENRRKGAVGNERTGVREGGIH